MVRPLSSLAKFSFVISNIRFPPRKRAAWRDTGMPASHYACQSPLNKIGLFLHVTCFRDGVPLGATPLRCAVRQPSLAQNRGNFCYLSDAPRWRTARASIPGEIMVLGASCVWTSTAPIPAVAFAQQQPDPLLGEP